MQFRPHALVLLALVSLGSPTLTLAASNPPLDIIELLGEIEDDSMLTAALAELEKKPNKNQKTDSTQTSSKQNTDVAAPVGGNKK